jgi:8-oxo-dGTP pyrophosphatase MutT (NUDIX family)
VAASATDAAYQAATPAPLSTRTVWPCATSFFAVSGVTETRVSPETVSRGTPINMDVPPGVLVMAGDVPKVRRRARAQLTQLAGHPLLLPRHLGPHPRDASAAAATSLGAGYDRRMQPRWKPSVTVAAVVERHRDGRSEFLLVEEHTPEGLKLNNPAGHLDPEESPLEAVVREVLEETARVYVPDRLVGVYLSRFQRPATGEDVTFLRFAFGGTAGVRDEGRTLDDGIVRTLWMTVDELRACRARHRSPHVLGCVEDYLAGRRYPLDAITTDATVYRPETKR